MLRLPSTLRDDLVAHALEGAPEEVCGVIAGGRDHEVDPDRAEASDDTEAGGRADVARRLCRVENAAATPRNRYAMDPAEVLETIESIEDAGEEVVGFYHSHPRGPSVPSSTDRDRATWDGYCYVIVSLDGDQSDEPRADVRAWRWDADADRFCEEPIVVETPP